MNACELGHRYAYVGVRYADGTNNLSGSGARARYYAHVYSCERCLDQRVEKIEGVEDNTYGKVMFSATPGDPKTIAPEHDRAGSRWR